MALKSIGVLRTLLIFVTRCLKGHSFMATQKELVAVVAKEMGVPIETVTVIDRYLAEAGLRTRAARGRGNTPMTYQDAANLIIATAWEANPKDAVRIVTEFRDLKIWRVKETVYADHKFFGETFGEALANATEIIPLHREEFSASDSDPRHMAVVVTMHRGNETTANIRLLREGEYYTFEFRQRGATGKVHDLRRTVQFSQITLGYVGEAIAEGFSK